MRRSVRMKLTKSVVLLPLLKNCLIKGIAIHFSCSLLRMLICNISFCNGVIVYGFAWSMVALIIMWRVLQRDALIVCIVWRRKYSGNCSLHWGDEMTGGRDRGLSIYQSNCLNSLIRWPNLAESNRHTHLLFWDTGTETEAGILKWCKCWFLYFTVCSHFNLGK